MYSFHSDLNTVQEAIRVNLILSIFYCSHGVKKGSLICCYWGVIFIYRVNRKRPFIYMG